MCEPAAEGKAILGGGSGLDRQLALDHVLVGGDGLAALGVEGDEEGIGVGRHYGAGIAAGVTGLVLVVVVEVRAVAILILVLGHAAAVGGTFVPMVGGTGGPIAGPGVGMAWRRRGGGNKGGGNGHVGVGHGEVIGEGICGPHGGQALALAVGGGDGG